MIDAAALDWGGCCDNENGGGHEYFWWTQQKMTDEYALDAAFVPMFSFKHAVAYPEGQRSVLFAKRGIRPVPHVQPAKENADTLMLYKYLRLFGGVSVPHASATNLGTDWRDNDPEAETAVEIYQGDRQNYERAGAPRAASPDDAIAGWHPDGLIAAALDKGYRLGFVASSDHFSTHLSYANVFAAAPTREAILDAFRKRHVYASTDNIVADVRSGDHIMGDEFSTDGPPSLSVKLIGSAPFAKVTIVKDGREVYMVEPKTKGSGLHLARRCRATGQEVLLLCTRRAIRRAVGLGQPDVDHDEVILWGRLSACSRLSGGSYSFPITASVNSSVPAAPPVSRVRCFPSL